MKCLVIRQPWAWAIVEGYKPIENRTWSTKYRGPLAIIAGSSKLSLKRGTEFLHRLDIQPPADLTYGAIIGVVDLVDVVPASKARGPFAEGPWCWMLGNPRQIRPIPFKGRLGLFDLPPALLRTGTLASISRSRAGI